MRLSAYITLRIYLTDESKSHLILLMTIKINYFGAFS